MLCTEPTDTLIANEVVTISWTARSYESEEWSVVTAATGAVAQFTSKAVKVVDGDTIDVLTDDKATIRLRFHGIDCPERGQLFGNNATQILKTSILGNIVKFVLSGQDKYDPTLGDIYHDGTLINRALVAARMAWHYVMYAPDDTALVEAEKQARKLKTGLWSGSHKRPRRGTGGG